MVDPALHPALRQNELGSRSPYALSYARYGASGASFGAFQGDVCVDPQARDTLRTVLHAAGLPAQTVARIVEAVSRPCPHGSPLSPADARAADAALDSEAGRAAVDAMDERLFQVVLVRLDACVAAAGRGGCAIAPSALLYMALWINMTGAPETLRRWLGGAERDGLPPPRGPAVTVAEIEAYLRDAAYFRQHPANLAHLRAAAEAGAAQLPQGQAAT